MVENVAAIYIYSKESIGCVQIFLFIRDTSYFQVPSVVIRAHFRCAARYAWQRLMRESRGSETLEGGKRRRASVIKISLTS